MLNWPSLYEIETYKVSSSVIHAVNQSEKVEKLTGDFLELT